MSTTEPVIRLRRYDSPADLVLRGYSRVEIVEKTAVDVGYHGRRYRDQLAGIDRRDYKIAHVARRHSRAAVKALLVEYSRGLRDRDAVLLELGLRGARSITLRQLYSGLGLTAQYRAAFACAQAAARRAGQCDVAQRRSRGVVHAAHPQPSQRSAASAPQYAVQLG